MAERVRTSKGVSPSVFWLFRNLYYGFVKAAIFEKYLPLMREAARNDYSSINMKDGRFVP